MNLRHETETIRFERTTPTYIMSRRLNPLEKQLFYLKSRTINILLYTLFAVAFAIPAFILIEPQSLGIAGASSLSIAFTIYMFLAGILIQEKIFISSLYMYSKKLHQNVYTDMAKQNVEKSWIVNHETFAHYTNISFNVKLLIGTSGEPFFDDLKRKLGDLEPDMVFTLEKPTIAEVFKIIEKCEFKNQPVCFYEPFSFECFSPEERRYIYERFMNYETGDPFKQKAIKSQSQEKVDEELEKLIEKSDTLFDIWSEK